MIPQTPSFTEVTVYTRPGCQPCRATVRALIAAGISATIRDVTEDGDGHQMVLDLGYAAVPVVAAGDEHWSGFRPDRIQALAARLAAKVPA